LPPKFVSVFSLTLRINKNFTISACIRDAVFHEIGREHVTLVQMNPYFVPPLHESTGVHFSSSHLLAFLQYIFVISSF
jgi:hypothetical protein